MRKALFLLTLVLLVALGATSAFAVTSPWCLKCKYLDGGPFATYFALCGAITSGVGYDDCWIQTVLGDDHCVTGALCWAGDY